ncbi:hypothetical protein F7D28_07045 [Prevotella copri]|nr:hypothetical protein [Segatella copri]
MLILAHVFSYFFIDSFYSGVYKPIIINHHLLESYSSFASFTPHALKGQKLLAQGSALGYYGRKLVAL